MNLDQTWNDMEYVGELLTQVPLIDGHNDFPYILRGWCALNESTGLADARNMPIGQTDISRLRKGRVGGQFWSAFVPLPGDESETSRLEALRDTLQQIDLIHQLIAANPGDLAFAGTVAEVWQAFRSGRIASLIGIEGLHQIGGSYSVLRNSHRLGVRYVTLCHNGHTEYVDSSTPECPRHGGLSAKGAEMIKEMNKTGIIVDLSHTSCEAQRQALQVSQAPVIFSHSSCHALQPHARNVTDDVLHQLKKNGGVIMICFLPSLSSLAEGEAPSSVVTVAEHIVYAGRIIGYEHVGIGSDFDGMLKGPQGLDDVSAFPSLVCELLAKGVGEQDILRVLGLNVLRVLNEVSVYAEKQQENIECSRAADQMAAVWTDAQRDLLLRQGQERGLRKCM
ncbi:hypothetical protein Q7P37_010904 [Cladosporium fusiforme]